MKILFAEDEQDLREVVKAYLELQGHTVTAVSNGQQAVNRTQTDAYDVIVMDIMMPVMDGITAMRKIRASGNTLPALFLTAKGEIQDRVEGLDAGADDYLTKPFALEELNARLRALDRRRRDYKVRTLSFGNLLLDTEVSEIRALNSIGLSQKEVRLLCCLLMNTDREMSAEELLAEVWPGENAGKELVWMYVSFLADKLKSIQADVTIEGDREHSFRLRETQHV